MDIEEIKKQIVQEVTTAVVAKLPDEAKAEIVAAAMKNVIDDYKFKSAIEAGLRNEADRRLELMLVDAEFDALLCRKFQEGIDLFMATLPKVVAAAMVGTLVGPSRYKTGAVYRGMCDLLGLDPEQ